MLNFLERFGRSGINTLQMLGLSGIFLARVLFRMPNLTKLWREFRAQLYNVGVLSVVIIVVSGLFIGMVVGLQGYDTLQKFGASSELGQLLALSITRELAPVVTGLLFAGRAGSALTAEIGLMKATEQLSSMDMMGVDPLGRVVYPRFIAGLIALPILTLIFAAVAVYGGYFVGVGWFSIDAGSFWANMQAGVNLHMDIFSCITKSLVFAFIVIWIAVFQGFNAVPNAKGISEATTKTVVYASLGVLGFDFVLTAFMIGDW